MYDRSVCFAWACPEERWCGTNLSVSPSALPAFFQKRCHTTNLSVIASQCQLVPKALSHNEPLSQSLSALPAPLSRGATGVPVLVLLDELGFSKPETEVLRCLGIRHRYEFSLVERSSDAVALGSGALFFAQDKTFFVQQGLPDLPMAPLLRGAVTEGD